MNSDPRDSFAGHVDRPIAYMERTREWYLALGYANPYVWAHNIEVPFQPLRRPLAQSRVAIITTAAPFRSDCGPQGAGAPYNAAAKFYQVYSGATDHDPDLRIAHVAIDRQHAGMDDSAAWFPLPGLREAADRGRIGSIAARFHGAPTNRSQRHTREVDAPEILALCRSDGVDAAILVPNCPVCHQTVSLVARHLEQNGIATVIMGCARDVVEHCGVPRLLFTDFPLGNAAGRPHDRASQAESLELALELLESAPAARTTVQSSQRWRESAEWKLDYCNVARLTPAQLRRLRDENDRSKAIAKAVSR